MSDDTAGGARVGARFGPYHLLKLLGKGGMGEVYEARDTVKDRVVALKLLPEAYSQDPVFRKRLYREAQRACQLQDPHVVPIHDYGEIDGQVYVDMRLVPGTDLRTTLRSHGPLPPPRAVAIARQIASALDEAHTAGICHRDVKPENILIGRDDFACLVDFGLASATTDEKLTQVGSAIGTFAYMAPERFSNAEVTYSCDIYSLACVLHECLTGSRPYPADSVSVLVTAHLMAPIPKPSAVRPGLSAAFDAVIARGMAKNPAARYATAGDLALAATAALTSADRDRADRIIERSHDAAVPLPPPPSAPTVWSGLPPPRAPQAPLHPPSNPSVPIARMTSPQGPWTPPPVPPRPPAKGPAKSRLPLVLAAVAVAIVLGAVAVVAVVMASRPTIDVSSRTTTPGPTTSDLSDTSATSPVHTTTETTPTPTVTAEERRLLSLLPEQDYTSCEPVEPIADAVATVDCEDNRKAGGPTVARYALYPDEPTLDRAFQRNIDQVELQTCPGPGGQPSPTTWSYGDSPTTAGSMACGVYKDTPNVVWTQSAELLLGDVQGSDLEALRQWWRNES